LGRPAAVSRTTVMPMQDQETVAALVAADPDGIAEAYDRYAVPLYSFCRSLLPEPDAAGAVLDTFLIATAKFGGLRHPDSLRALLYAAARNECYRPLRSGQATSVREEAPISRPVRPIWAAPLSRPNCASWCATRWAE